MDIAEQLRNEIERRGLTPTEVARGSGVPQPAVFDFIHKDRLLRADKLSAVAGYLGFHLVKKPTGTIRMNISVPVDLRERMQQFDHSANWSAIAAKAFHEWCDGTDSSL